jgi:hypothetical protein
MNFKTALHGAENQKLSSIRRSEEQMRLKTVDVRNSVGLILSCPIFRSGGRKLLAKGHVLSDEDIRLLETEGMQQVSVTELEEGEIDEDEPVMAVAGVMCCGSVEIRIRVESLGGNICNTLSVVEYEEQIAVALQH